MFSIIIFCKCNENTTVLLKNTLAAAILISLAGGQAKSRPNDWRRICLPTLWHARGVGAHTSVLVGFAVLLYLPQPILCYAFPSVVDDWSSYELSLCVFETPCA